VGNYLDPGRRVFHCVDGLRACSPDHPTTARWAVAKW
jgi:hypothetical protein